MRITRSIVPNLFTLVNLYMGFTAIVYIANENYEYGAICVLVAAIFDMLDGVVARLIDAASEFGVELDSLCDAVSFGIAPSFMLYKVHFYVYQDIGILLASLPALAGVIRLARFNIKLESLEDKKYFVGLPIPSAALTILTYIMFFHIESHLSEEAKAYLICIVAIVCSLAMVSNIKFANLPRYSLNYIKNNKFSFSVFNLAILAVAISKGFLIFPLMLLYIFLSSLLHFINWLRTKHEIDDDFDDSEDEEFNIYE